MKGIDLDADGIADNTGSPTQASDNSTSLTNAQVAKYGVVATAIGGAYVVATTDLQKTTNAANLAAKQAANDSALLIAQATLTAAEASANTVTGLAKAIADYDTAVTAKTAATAALATATNSANAALANYNVAAVAAKDLAGNLQIGVNDYVAAVGGATIIYITANTYTAKLGTGVTETTHPGITAVLASVQNYLAALKASVTANAAEATAKTALVTLDPHWDGVALADFVAAFPTAPAGAVPTAPEITAAQNILLTGVEATYLALAQADPNFMGSFVLDFDANGFVTGYIYDDGGAQLVTVSTNINNPYNDFLAKKAAYQAVAAVTSKYEAVTAAKDGVKSAQTAISNLAKAVADVVSVDALVATRKELTDTLTKATAAVNVIADLNTDATIAKNEVYTAPATNTAITFGKGDLIYVGGYTFNKGSAAKDGDNSVLEFFTKQAVGGVEVIFEKSVFGSNAATPETVVITLTGLTLEDLEIADGFIGFGG